MKILFAFDSQTGILLVGHGSREPDGNEPVLELCRQVEAQLGITPVQPCYLEFATPTIEEGLASLGRRGVERVVVVPLQLTAGRHVRYDIPCEVGKSLAKMSNMFVSFARHVGSHPSLIDIAHSRLVEALAGRPLSLGGTEHILVARGSRDPLVRGEVLCLVRDRKTAGNGEGFRVCFLAMGNPTFEEGLSAALSNNPVRIIVQPHLLYPGRLLERVNSTVADLATANPHIEWVTTGALGPDARLVDCVVDLAVEVGDRDFRRELV